MRSNLFLAVLLLLFTGTALQAQPVRQQRSATVPQGIRQGNITPGEARHLRKKRANIHRDVQGARANDGRVSAAERRHIRREAQQYKRQRNRAMNNQRTR